MDDQYRGQEGESDSQNESECSREEDQDAEYLPTAGNFHRFHGNQGDQGLDDEQMAHFQQYQEQYRREQEQLNGQAPDGNMEVKEFISEEDAEYGDQGEEGLYEGEEDSDEEQAESRQGHHNYAENEAERNLHHGANPGLDSTGLEHELQNYDGLQEMQQDNKNGAF